MDQFKKLSQSGLKPEKVDVETLAKAREADEKEKERRKVIDEEKTQRQIERNMREREREIRKIKRDKEREWDIHGDRRRWVPTVEKLYCRIHRIIGSIAFNRFPRYNFCSVFDGLFFVTLLCISKLCSCT